MNPHAAFAAIISVILVHASKVSSFAHPVASSARKPTTLFLEARIAEMIDKEMDRLKNIDLWKRKEVEKVNDWKAKEPTLPMGFDFNSVAELVPNKDAAAKIQRRKDKRMARDDPARYCADRCVATGSCEVWEDMFELSAKEVQMFCNDCVLSEGEEPCDVPEKFIENAGKNAWELRP